jgi:hypothetical protein
LHRGREFAVSTAELFKKHVANMGVWLIDANSEHQLLDMKGLWIGREISVPNGQALWLFLSRPRRSNSPAA